jgi:hypothetical protein
MSTTTKTHVNGGPKHEQTEVCPTCGARISRAEFERITRIDEARQKQLAEELAALARDKEDLERQRNEIAEAAGAEATAKLEAETQRLARETARAEKEAAAAQERAEREHKKEVARVLRTLERMQAQVAKRDAKAKADVARAEARARAAASAAAREAKQAHDKEAAALRAEVRLVERRRVREADGMRKTIAVLERKADDQNRRHFGAEGETSVLDALRDAYPGDRVERHGADGDIVHRVVDSGREIGRVIIECKNTRAFSKSYVAQAQRAMRAHQTSYGIVASRVLPGRHEGICVVDDVLVVQPPVVREVMAVIRSSMVTIARLSASDDGKASKAAAMLAYVRGGEFSAAMKRVASKVATVRKSLSRERSYHDGWWRTREDAYSSIARDIGAIETRVRDILVGPPTTTAANDNAKGAKEAAP